MTVHAPFCFAPIHRWVWFPDWGPLASHDVPFKDGLSGEITVDITAETPLLAGGPRRKPTAEKAGEVWPFRTIHPTTGEDCYAVTGSALQGMIRSTLEVAAFGKLGPWLAAQRFGIRDLSEPAMPFYRNRLRPGSVRAGLLRRESDTWWLKPCETTDRRIRFSDIPGTRSANWRERSTAPERYGWVAGKGPWRLCGSDPRNCRIEPDPKGDAWLVITGNTGVRDQKKAKSREFVFVEDRLSQEMDVSADVVAAFRLIHEDGGNDDRAKWNPTWRLFLEQGYPLANDPIPFEMGGTIPVFYICDEKGNVASFGLAYMFKLAYSASTHDMLRNSTPDHLDATRLDLASLIFGAANDADNSLGLKRRASFDMALSTSQAVRLQPFRNAVLLSPKPSYFPIYVRQSTAASPDQLPQYRSSNGKDRREPYATYTPLNDALFRDRDSETKKPVRRIEHECPELAGVKLWPARGQVAQRVRSPYLDEADNRKVSTTLNAVAAGTVFSTTLRFHNLRPMELGALLWAMTFGDRAAWTDGAPVTRRHRQGMGKPYGLGEISLRLGTVSARDVHGRPGQADPAALITAFVDAIGAAYRPAAGHSWPESVQVRTVMRAAEPQPDLVAAPVKDRSWKGRSWTVGRFNYMELNPEGRDWNDFQAAKKQGQFLARYADGQEVPRKFAAALSAPVPPVGRPTARQPAPAGNPRPRRVFCYGELVTIVAEKGSLVRVRFDDGGEEEVDRSELRFET